MSDAKEPVDDMEVEASGASDNSMDNSRQSKSGGQNKENSSEDDEEMPGTQEGGSMPERLRQRKGKKPSYAEDLDDYMDWESDEAKDDAEQQLSTKKKKKQRAESCSECGEGDKLIYCSTCSAAYHLACLNPPLKVAPRGRWSCPQCVDPLAEIEKFLDCEMRAKNSSGLYSGVEEEAGSSSELTKHYLVKWKSRSYLHCSWIPEADIERAIKAYSGLKMKYNNFRRQLDSVKSAKAMEDEWVPIRSEWTTVEKVLDFRQTGNVKEYLVKWKELGYEDISWEVEEDIATFQAHMDRFNKMRTRRVITPKKRKGSLNDNREAQKKRKEFKAFEATPKFLSGGVLHAYQLEGLNFLRFAWQQGKHVILADEMGLGKTIQSISFLASLMDEGLPPPHLVVAPLSTLRNWEREFSTWAPQMNTVMYVGSAQARATIRELEFYLPKDKAPQKKKKQKKKPVPVKQSKQDRIKFDVLLTSYEMINFDTSVLKSIKWECLIVDEGHRLKNKDSKLFQTLQQYTTRHRVLLTGTPLQNNLDELFMLMHFLDAGKFASLEEFQQEFKDLNQEEQVGRLHKMLAPHLLRRVKKDVMKDLPPKKELILRVELSALQKEYYKAILTRNYQILARQGGPQISLNNVVMELRKLCGHPYLLEGVEEELRTGQDPNRQLIEASGKLLLMDKMMAKLKAEGHRVLIYSQFKVMLDILEDWMSFKQWSYERIDGNISGAERQIRIDRFNAPNSKRFCFLLSTRAGGLGINLATADTVIIYDSDWNPHADLQAMARAHRLGQTKKVMIYRLVTRGTIEERMMQMTKKKMVLEHLVVGRLKNQQVLNQEELDDILRYGAKELFADENDETKKSQQIHYDDAAIDRLLDRSQVKAEEAASDEEDDDLLKAFKVANFEYVDEEDTKDAEGNQDANGLDSEAKAKYWDDLLKQRFEEQKQRDAAAELGKGKRARKQVLLAEDDLAGMASVSSDDEDDEALAEGIGTEANAASKETLDGAEKKTPLSKKKPKVDSSEPPGPPPLMQGDGKSLKILGFSRKHRAAFVQILMRFGIGDFSWSEFIPRMRPKSPEQIKQYGTLFLTHIAEDISDLPTFSDGVPKEGLRIQDVLVRLAILHLIQDKVKNHTEGSTNRLFSDDVYKRIPGLMNVRVWKEAQDWKLLQGILKHGYGRWQEIIDDGVLDLKVPACKELQLPIPPGSALDGAKSPNKQSPQENTAISNQDNVTSLDPTQGGGQDDTGTLSADKQEEQRVHKRMVEFLKKRISLLEKALNAEYHQESMEEQKVEEENEIAGNVVETPEAADSVQPEHPRPDPSSLIPLAPEEIAAHAYDMDPRRLEVARIYNEICKLVNVSEVDASEAYAGNKSAGIRLRKTTRQIDGLCIDMRKAFMILQPSGTVPGERGFGASFLGEDADVLSDENDEELDAEMDSDGEARNAAGGSHRFEAVNHQERPPDKVSPMHSNSAGWKNSQVTSVIGSKDASGRVAISPSVGSKDVPGASGISTPPIGSKVVAGASTMPNSQGSNTAPRWSPAVVVLDD